MSIVLDGTAGVTTPGLSSTSNATVTGTLGVTGVLTVTASNEHTVFRATNAASGYTSYYYNTSSLAGYVGNGSSILSGAANTEMIFRGAGGAVLAYGNNRILTAGSAGVTIDGTLGVTTGAAVGGATPGAGGLAFPATAVAVADANTLDDYEEYTSASTACTGALLVSVVWRVVKIGKQITLHSEAVYGTGQNTTNFTLGLTLPAAYYPVAFTRLPLVNVIVNNASQANVGVLIVSSTTGVMTVYRDATLATSWGSAANTGIEGAFSVSWLTA